MRILMIAPTPFFADRGCHVRIRSEAEGLLALGHEVLVCTYPLGNEVEGIATRRTLPVPWYKKLSAGPSVHKYYIDMLLVATVKRAIKEWKPDIVHAHLHEGAFIAALADGQHKIPMIFDHQGSLTGEIAAHNFTNQGSLQHRLLSRIERWVENRADKIVTSTEANAETLRGAAHIRPDAVYWLNDVVDVNQYDLGEPKSVLRKRLGISTANPVLIYAGVLASYQGVDLMLEALAQVNQSHPLYILIIGFPNEDIYKAKAAQLGLQNATKFLGRVSFDVLPQYLRAADMAISAKLPGSEGNGKLLTYMAAGLPIVAFDTLVNRQYLDNTAQLVSQIDANSLAHAVIYLLEHEQEAKSLGARAKARVSERFSLEGGARQLQEIYEGVIGT